MRRKVIYLLIFLLTLSGSCTDVTPQQRTEPTALVFKTGTGSIYSYGSTNGKHLTLNADGAVLYVTYTVEDFIARVNTSDMVEIDKIYMPQECHPYRNILSPDDNYLYVVCTEAGPGKIVKVNLDNMQQQVLALTGDPVDLAINEDGTRLWVIYRTYPYVSDDVLDPNLNAPEMSGYLAEIDANSFTITSEISILSVPYSIWYSAPAQKLFISHGLHQEEKERHPVGSDYYETLNAQWERITIYSVVKPGRITLLPNEIRAGANTNFTFFPSLLTNWSDSGEYFVIPNSFPDMPKFSVRVANAVNLSTFDLNFTDANNETMGVYRAKKVRGLDAVWGTVAYGNSQTGYDKQPRNIVIKISTEAPYDAQAYMVSEVSTSIGDLAVSPDGDTVYVENSANSEIVKWTPDNNNLPICNVDADPINYHGSPPASIFFNASQSYDTDQGDELTYSWDFNGDKTFGDSYDSGTDSQPVKNFTQDYSGPISVRVTDNHGAHSDCSVNVMIDIT
jgi:hypothetical protein